MNSLGLKSLFDKLNRSYQPTKADSLSVTDDEDLLLAHIHQPKRLSKATIRIGGMKYDLIDVYDAGCYKKKSGRL